MKLAFVQSLGATVMPRLVLLVNHVVAAEPMAAQRLRPHAGKCIQLQLRDIPSLLSWLPSSLTMAVTAAGLLEWQPVATDRADLVATLDASNPVQSVADAVAGRRPRVEVAGDAALAADVNWLAEHLRWDLQDDLARLVGDGPAMQLMRIATTVAAGLRDAVRTVAQSASDRARPSAPMPAESPPR
jgi:ubiquinone biosynthesis protein UbiJ